MCETHGEIILMKLYEQHKTVHKLISPQICLPEYVL